MARHPKGSTPKLTKELIEELSTFIQKGCYIETASILCGISKDTFYRWLKKGKNTSTNCLERELSDAVTRALAEAEMRDIEIINKAAFGSSDILATDDKGEILKDSEGNPIILEYGLPPNWRVSAWRLERKFPKKWGKNTTPIADEDEDKEEKQTSTLHIEFVEKP